MEDGVVHFSESPRVGIDAGASLWKVVLVERELEMRFVPVGAFDEIRSLVRQWDPRTVHVTGCGSYDLAGSLHGARVVPEFDAWGCGASILAARAHLRLPRRYLLISLGTGTSILEVDGAVVRRAGGVALGGGTVLGLARLLCGAETFQDVVTLAADGDRTGVDLFVRDLYRDGGIPLRADATASSFGKLASRRPADLAHALMWLVGETIGVVCGGLAQALAIDTLVFGGTALTAGTILMDGLRGALAGNELTVSVLRDGAFCGAVGAAATTERAA